MTHTDLLPKASYPEDAGISSEGLLRFIDEAEKKGLEFHGVMVLRKGMIACEMAWQPYDLDTPHTLFSLSKSFTSCAAGFAVAEGLLRYDSKVAEVLKDKLPKAPHPLIHQITLHDLLCMGSGLNEKSDGVRAGTDWVADILKYPVDHQPGSHFHYNSMGSYLVSAMVQKVTGQTCRDYLMPRLFDKLGIKKPQWDCCPMGINIGGFGLHLTTRDIAKFGQLLLQDGIWQGERVLPGGWVKLATKKHIDNSNCMFNGNLDWGIGYGYQFWRTRGERYRGDGMYGQFCIIDEKLELVIAITAGIPDMGAEADLIHDVLVPGVDAPAADKAAQEKLQKRIKGLKYALPRDDGSGQDLTGSYTAKGGVTLRLSQMADGRLGIMLKSKAWNKAPSFILRSGKAHQGEAPGQAIGEHPHPYLGSYAWNKGALHISVRMPSGPFTYQAVITPTKKGLDMDLKGAGSPEGSYSFTKQA